MTPIDRAFQLYQKLPQDDDELKSEWTKYLTIVVSSCLENGIREILSRFADSTNQPRLARYTKKGLAGFRNPNPDRLLDLINSFDEEWGKQLNVYWQDQIRDSIRSLINLRNNAAHGQSFTAGFRDITQYADDAKKLLKFLHEQCRHP